MLQPPLSSRSARVTSPPNTECNSPTPNPWPRLGFIHSTASSEHSTATNRRHSLESPTSSPVLGNGLWSRPQRGLVSPPPPQPAPPISLVRPSPAPRRRSQSLVYRSTRSNQASRPFQQPPSVSSPGFRPPEDALENLQTSINRSCSPPLPSLPPLPSQASIKAESDEPLESSPPPLPPKTWAASADVFRPRPLVTRTPSARTPSLSRAESSSSRASSSIWTPAGIRSSTYSTSSAMSGVSDKEELDSPSASMDYLDSSRRQRKSPPAQLDMALAGLGIHDTSAANDAPLTGKPFRDGDDFDTSLEELARFARSLPSPVPGTGSWAGHSGLSTGALGPEVLSRSSTEPSKLTSTPINGPGRHRLRNSTGDWQFAALMQAADVSRSSSQQPESSYMASARDSDRGTADFDISSEQDFDSQEWSRQFSSIASRDSGIDDMLTRDVSRPGTVPSLVDLTGQTLEERDISPETSHLILAQCLSGVSDTLAKLSARSLVVLDISYCGLNAIPDALAGLTNLQELSVTGNQMTARTLPISLYNLISLRALAADDCALETIGTEVVQLGRLHTLSIRHNALTCLPTSLCRQTALETLLVDGNPLQGNLRMLVESNSPAYQWSRLRAEITCHGPDPPAPSSLSRSNSQTSPPLLDSITERPSPSTPNGDSSKKWSTRIFKRMRSGTNLRSAAAGSPVSKLRKSRSKRQSFLGIEATPVQHSGDTRGQVNDPCAVTRAVLAHLRDVEALADEDRLDGPVQQTTDLRASASSGSSLPQGCISQKSLSGLPALQRSASLSDSALPEAPSLQRTSSKHRTRGNPSHSTSSQIEPVPPSRLQDDPTKRARVIREIIETEQTYLRGLSELCEIYLADTSALPNSERRAVFGNIEAILDFHDRVLLPDLLEASGETSLPRLPSGDSCKTACDVAKVFVRNAAWLGIYSSYVNGFDAALAHIRAWSKEPGQAGDCSTLSVNKRKRIRAWTKDCKRHPSHSQIDLVSYLLLPVQRIPRYRMLLESLAACTPDPRASVPLSRLDVLEPGPLVPNAAVQEALELVSRVATSMNERKRETEGRARLYHWQEVIGDRFRSPLVQPHRSLVKEGRLQVLQVVTRETIQLERREMMVLLCTDLLILVDPDKDPVELYTVVRLSIPGNSSADGQVLRLLVDNRVILYLSCQDVESWAQAINEQFAVCATI